jgi:hypothetical protein
MDPNDFATKALLIFFGLVLLICVALTLAGVKP